MTLLITVIVLALLFDFINGFHDAANSIATVVSTRVLSPVSAVIWAALFNFVAFFIFKDHSVANTIAKTVQDRFTSPEMSPLPMILAGLLAAISWNLITWWYGIPSSSSHTLIGGFAGAFIAAYGFEAVRSGVVWATAIFIVVAPVAGMLMAYLISLWFLHSFRKSLIAKFVSITIMVGVAWAVWNTLEFKKDFNGGASYTYMFDRKVSKDELKKALTFKDDHYKEYAPVIAAGKDSLGQPDASGTVYTIRTDYLKKPGQTTELSELTVAIEQGIGKTKAGYRLLETHRISEQADPKERFDTSNLKNGFETYWLKVIFHGANFKWILLGFIVMVIGGTTLVLSSINMSQTNTLFKRLQLFSSAAFSIGHGGNDAQKVMGIISVALIANGNIASMKEMPTWVPLACYTAIAAGTLSGGWKIVKTMGGKITKVTPFEGVAAETAGAITLFFTEGLKFPWKIGGEVIKGIPVSTTHTITGSIIGVGATKRLSAVRWGVTINLVWAWILTIPVSALLAAIFYELIKLFLR
ncbi:MAG: inorganic phosphate transporter [Bacteroidota bacterium]|jgi:phosphate/sulfate permease|nr:inorganic phosphate transporter [Bacteroidia bacterium]